MLNVTDPVPASPLFLNVAVAGQALVPGHRPAISEFKRTNLAFPRIPCPGVAVARRGAARGGGAGWVALGGGRRGVGGVLRGAPRGGPALRAAGRPTGRRRDQERAGGRPPPQGEGPGGPAPAGLTVRDVLFVVRHGVG